MFRGRGPALTDKEMDRMGEALGCYVSRVGKPGPDGRREYHFSEDIGPGTHLIARFYGIEIR